MWRGRGLWWLPGGFGIFRVYESFVESTFIRCWVGKYFAVEISHWVDHPGMQARVNTVVGLFIHRGGKLRNVDEVGRGLVVGKLGL